MDGSGRPIFLLNCEAVRDPRRLRAEDRRPLRVDGDHGREDGRGKLVLVEPHASLSSEFRDGHRRVRCAEVDSDPASRSLTSRSFRSIRRPVLPGGPATPLLVPAHHLADDASLRLRRSGLLDDLVVSRSKSAPTVAIRSDSHASGRRDRYAARASERHRAPAPSASAPSIPSTRSPTSASDSGALALPSSRAAARDAGECRLAGPSLLARASGTKASTA